MFAGARVARGRCREERRSPALLGGGAELAEGLVDLAAHGRGVSAGGGDRAVALLLDLQVDLLAEDGDVPRGLDPDAHLLAHDGQNGDFDVVSDHDALVGLSCQYEHGWTPPNVPATGRSSLAGPLPTCKRGETLNLRERRRRANLAQKSVRSRVPVVGH